ncbi:unnamed protein product [Symbiodinium natans]|uniref:Leucine rich repeat protein n=1 Tax=Symbiodinium natans TaxID=878477 RepID=A0A812R3D2_9DINO|nr:unnamed protein product [Symbiodinium natans]
MTRAHISDEAEPKIWPPIWVYGINDHLDVPGELPSGFEPTGALGVDLRKLCSTVNAAVHPAFRMKRAREGQAASPSKSQLPSSHEARRRPSMLGKAPDMSALLGGGLGLGGFHEEPKPPKEGPNLMVKSFLFDRATISLIGLLLPTVQNIKVMSFSDCNLDCEMLRLLARGLVGNCSVESLQIEWNNLDLPLPTLTEEEIPTEGEEGDVETSAFDRASSILEARERKRYTLQSERLLTNFKEWLESRFGSLKRAWEALASFNGAEGMEEKLAAPDFHSRLFETLGVSGSQVFEVFEVLDGPDYGADGGGQVSLQVMKEAVEGLPEAPETEEAEEEQEEDALGLSLAAFIQPSTVLECVSYRACSITRFELGPLCTSLSACPWQLRALNLWENRICDRGAELLAKALDAYRGLEYLGLGRNRITDIGLQALCQPFKPVVPLEDSEVAAARDQIAKQQVAAKSVADAKEKARGTEFQGRQRRVSVPLVDELEERTESDGPNFFLRKLSELKCLVLSENPIKCAEVVEQVQPFGPRGADLLLRCTPAATELGCRRPDLLKEKERKPLLNLGQNLGHGKDVAAAGGSMRATGIEADQPALQQTLLEIRQLNQQKRSSVSMFRVFGYDEMDAFDDTLIPSVVPKGKRHVQKEIARSSAFNDSILVGAPPAFKQLSADNWVFTLSFPTSTFSSSAGVGRVAVCALVRVRRYKCALNFKIHEEVSARGRVDDLQRELKLETSDVMQDSLPSGPTTPKGPGRGTSRASHTSSAAALPGQRSPSADASLGVEALPPNPSQVRQLAVENAATLERLRAENARLRNLCAERGLDGDGSPRSPRRARSRPKGTEAQPLRSLLQPRTAGEMYKAPASPASFATPRSQDGFCVQPGIPAAGVLPVPVRYVTPRATPRAVSPPPMPAPAVYAAPVRSFSGYPTFGGTPISL